MQYIDFNVQHQTITRTDNYEVVGRSQNYLYARFTFCEEWEGLTQTAVFSTNSGKHYSALIEEGECLVPWEVLQGAEFWVGVFAGERITTSTVRVSVKPGVKIGAKPGMAPSPTAYETLVASAAASAESAEAASEQAAASAELAAQAEQTVQDAIERAEQVVESVVLNEEKMAQYVDAAEGHADTAAESAQAASDFAAEAEDWSKKAEAAAGGGVLSFNNRSGYVEPQAGDYTAAMVGARPDTWMPSAADVGARPDTWMPSAADVGAAPAGYGLGDGCYGLTSADDVNTVWKTGWYYWGTDIPVNAPVFLGNNQRVLMHVQGVSKNNFVQEFFSVNDSLKTLARRSYAGGAMGELEYVNPPLVANTEYRTTERYLDKPVYVKAVDCGSLPASTYKEISHGASNVDKILPPIGHTSEGWTIPTLAYGGNISTSIGTTVDVVANKSSIYIVTNRDRSSATATVLIKYTKTTD